MVVKIVDFLLEAKIII